MKQGGKKYLSAAKIIIRIILWGGRLHAVDQFAFAHLPQAMHWKCFSPCLKTKEPNSNSTNIEPTIIIPIFLIILFYHTISCDKKNYQGESYEITSAKAHPSKLYFYHIFCDKNVISNGRNGNEEDTNCAFRKTIKTKACSYIMNGAIIGSCYVYMLKMDKFYASSTSWEVVWSIYCAEKLGRELK